MDIDYENLLTKDEKSLLQNARTSTREVYALEHYSRLWDSIDRRQGPDNELTKHFVEEHRQASYERPLDHEESARVDMMRNAYLFPRIGVPEDVRRALLFFDVKRRQEI